MVRHSCSQNTLWESIETISRYCDMPDCRSEGEYRAPKSRDHLNDYYWFCLEHVRAYNKQWNYYEGYDQDTIEYHQRYDGLWQRPTWPFHQMVSSHKRKMYAAMREDPILGAAFQFYDQESNTENKKSCYGHIDHQCMRALQILGYKELPSDIKLLKRTYLDLVKRLHPDINGDDPIAEDKLKEVNQAYQYLKKMF